MPRRRACRAPAPVEHSVSAFQELSLIDCCPASNQQTPHACQRILHVRNVRGGNNNPACTSRLLHHAIPDVLLCPQSGMEVAIPFLLGSSISELGIAVQGLSLPVGNGTNEGGGRSRKGVDGAPTANAALECGRSSLNWGTRSACWPPHAPSLEGRLPA